MRPAFILMTPWLIFSAYIGWEYGWVNALIVYLLGGMLWAALCLSVVAAYHWRKGL